MSTSREGEGKGVKLVGTNDSSKAVGFMEELDGQIKVQRLQKVMNPDFETEEVEELKKRYKDQKNRVRLYETRDDQRKALLAQINAIVPVPGPADPMVIAYNAVGQEIHDMEWKGRMSEEGTEERRRNEWNQAVARVENLVSAVAQVEQYIKGRVEESIYMQVKKKLEEVDEPGDRLRKMYALVKGLIGGDQVKERLELMRKLENLQSAASDSECKQLINDMRVIRQRYRDSAKAEGQVKDIDERVMLDKLGEISAGNNVDFDVRFEYRLRNKEVGKTFEQLSEEMEKILDKAIRKRFGENGAKGMDIDNQRAVEDQAFGMVAGSYRSMAGGSGVGGSGKREKRKGDCYDWKYGDCVRGDECWYQHDPKTFGTKKRERERGDRSHRSPSRGREERGRERDRSRDRLREQDTTRGDRDRSSERDRRGGGNERDGVRAKDRRSSSGSRSPDDRNRIRDGRARDRDRSRSGDRDGDRTPRGSNTPNKPTGGGGRYTK